MWKNCSESEKYSIIYLPQCRGDRLQTKLFACIGTLATQAMLEPSVLSLNTDTARMPNSARAQPLLNWRTRRSPTIGFVLKVKRGWIWSCINSVTTALFVPGGVLLGGYLVRRFDLKRSLKMAARFCVIASVFTVAGSSAWFIPGCGVPDLAGVTAPYSGRWEKEALKDLTPPQSFSHNFIQRAE